jgi:hypothetical protein
VLADPIWPETTISFPKGTWPVSLALGPKTAASMPSIGSKADASARSPGTWAFEVDFNRFDAEGLPPDALEAAFGEFEGKTASVIRSIRQDGELPADEAFSYVLNLICQLAIRNPSMRESMTVARRRSVRIIGDLLTADHATYQHQVAAARAAGFVPNKEVPYKQIKEHIDGDDYQLEISTTEHLQ